MARENLELPSGRIEGESVELAVRTLSRLNTPQAFEDLILKERDGRLVRLGDVGRAEIAPRNERTALKNEGVPMVAVVLRPQPGVNYIDLADEFYRRVERIRPGLPEDIEIGYGFDTTRYIRRSIAEVVQTVFVALSLVVLVIFAFLRDWRTTLIPALVIPVSLIGAFGLMWAAGFSINVLTLLALVLAIGLVVDDAIVVLENIYSKIEAGQPPLQAGIGGTREIFFAVIATTLALVAVLMPLLFMGGLTGRLFREFGAVLAGAVAISSFVALSLTPMLSSRLLKRRRVQPWLYRKTERFFRTLAHGYRGGLESFLARRWLVFPLLAACLGLTVLLWSRLPSELAPLEDRSSLRLSATAPEGATYAYMDRFMDQLVTEIADEVPERRTLVSVTSPGFGATSATNTGFARLILTEPHQRQRSQSQIAAALERRLAGLTGANTRVTESPTISVGRRGGPPIQFVLQAPDLPALEAALPGFLEEARSHPTLSFVDADLKFTNPELRVSIDRARARDLGISARDIAQSLQLALAEQRLGFFLLGGKQYEVIVQVERSRRDETADLRGLYVPSASGEPVLLDRLVTVTEESRPPQLYRFDRYVSATLSAGLAPGETIDRGIAAMQEVAERTLPGTFDTALSGQARDFVESSNALLWAFVLAFVLVYLVLAGQFESFRDPLTILLTVPLALAGALVAPVVLRPDAQPVQQDRHHDADRPGDQERHPDRRVRQPAASRRPVDLRRGGRRRRRPLPPGADDHPVDGAGHPADRPGARRRSGEPGADGGGDPRRTAARHRPDALRRPGAVHLPGAKAPSAYLRRERGRAADRARFQGGYGADLTRRRPRRGTAGEVGSSCQIIEILLYKH